MTGEIVERSFEPTEDAVSAKLETADCGEETFSLAKDIYEQEEQRLGSVQDKIRALLSVSGLALPLASAFMPRLRYPIIGVMPLLLFLAAVVLLLIAVKLNTRARPSLDADGLDRPEARRRAEMAAAYHIAAHRNSFVTDFLATVYVAAYRAFATGLVTLVAIAAFLPWLEMAATSPTPPAVNVTVIPATQRAPVTNVVAYPSTQPAPSVQVLALPASQPAPVINVYCAAPQPAASRPATAPSSR